MKELLITDKEDWQRKLTIEKVKSLPDCWHVKFHAFDKVKDKETNYYEMFLTSDEVKQIKEFL
jgi:hypothetical protein